MLAGAVSRTMPSERLVSIVLPTYNRSRFLPQAFASITGQSLQRWELIVVDDGSTDDTHEQVERLASQTVQPVRYVYQENQGPAAARNAGIERSSGDYIAFFDSDDQWLPNHLDDCVAALDAHSDVDWVYGAGRRVEMRTGAVLLPNSFYPGGKRHRFLKLKNRLVGRLHIIEDPDVTRCMLAHGLYCGLQNSVVRREIFRDLRIPNFRIGEDRLFVVMALKAGARLAYFEDVHVIYQVHDENCSAAGTDATVEKRVKVHNELLAAMESIEGAVCLSRGERRALRRALGSAYFWQLGYSLLWAHGSRTDAIRMYRKGLRLSPWSPRCWKTYLLALIRVRAVGSRPTVE
jgi:glycosyltransferase involved in cell wall biosynthesis